MQTNGSTDYEDAAKLTVDLVNHSHTPDDVSYAILTTLIEMAADTDINIWLLDYGLSLVALSQLFSLQKQIGGGQKRAILYGDYEIGRKKDDSDA